MPSSNEINKTLTELIAEIDSRFATLREEIARKLQQVAEVMAEPAPPAAAAPAEEPVAGGGQTDLLFAAMASVHDVSGQAEILRSLLDGSAQFSGRSILFVLRGGSLAPWQSRGFSDDGAIKQLNVDASSGLASRAISDRMAVAAAAAEFSQKLVEQQGNPTDGNAWVLPLVVRDKVAAILYADAGTEGKKLDASALQILVKGASHWLEIQALRKTAGAPEAASDSPPVAAPVAPPAPQLEERAPQEAAPAPQPVVAPAEEPESAPIAPPPAAEVTAAAPAPIAAAPAAGGIPDGLSPEEQELHKKAKRFAKLLVDEIKLYNQAKVAEGRTNKDLYARLREDIDKSRATYDKRYGPTAAAGAKYFDQEIVRILAEGDVTAMGPQFTP